MITCPKCKSKTLAQEVGGFGVYDRHVRCYTCGLLHVRGAAQDSIQRQVDPVGWERDFAKRMKNVKVVEA